MKTHTYSRTNLITSQALNPSDWSHLVPLPFISIRTETKQLSNIITMERPITS